jgi:hypothetical protein
MTSLERHGNSLSETPRTKAAGVLIRSSAIAFAFGVQALHSSRAVSGGPSTGRASRSGGTSPVTREASPSAEEVRAPHALPGVCAESSSPTSCTSRSFLANTVVFLPLALRQRTHPNAIQFSRYCRKYSTLIHKLSSGILPASGLFGLPVLPRKLAT